MTTFIGISAVRARARSHDVARRSSIVLLTALPMLWANATALHAQVVSSSVSTQTRTGPASGTVLRSSFFGALTGTALAAGYYFLSEHGNRSGNCHPVNCALPFLSFSGAFAGLTIGKELDAQRRAFEPRVGDKLQFGFTEGAVLTSPTFIDVRDSLIAVVSDSGAQLMSAATTPKALRRRAAGLSSLRQVAIVPDRGSMVLGTANALWQAPLLSGPAKRLAGGAVDALASSRDAVLSASGKRIRFQSGNDDNPRVDSLDMRDAVTAIAYDSIANSWLVATDSQVVRVSSVDGKLALTGAALALPASARAVAFNDQWIAVALGNEGVIAVRRSEFGHADATPVRVINEPRFAYDLAFLGSALYVAGGVDGLFQLSLSPTARVVGSSRQVQFATTIRAGVGVLWVGDRNRQSVVRIVP